MHKGQAFAISAIRVELPVLSIEHTYKLTVAITIRRAHTINDPKEQRENY